MSRHIIAASLNEYSEYFNKQSDIPFSKDLSKQLGILAFSISLNMSDIEELISKILNFCEILDDYDGYKKDVQKIINILNICQMKPTPADKEMQYQETLLELTECQERLDAFWRQRDALRNQDLK